MRYLSNHEAFLPVCEADLALRVERARLVAMARQPSTNGPRCREFEWKSLYVCTFGQLHIQEGLRDTTSCNGSEDTACTHGR